MAERSVKNNVIKIISGSKGKFPIKLGIIPNKLAITIYVHYVSIKGKSIPCWSYLSDGLLALKQKELLFTLLSGEKQDTSKFPTQPLQLFLLIYKYAAQNKLFEIGNVVKIGDKGLFGFPAIGVTYPMVNIPNAPFKRPTLSCLLLSKEEFFTAHTLGFTRVIARLGFEQNRYPCLPCNDLQRSRLNMQAVLQKSVVKNLARTSVKQCSVIMADGDEVVLNAPLAARVYLIAILKKQTANKPLCLLLQLLPEHEGCLVWIAEKDSTEMSMKATATGDSIAGSFLILLPGQASDGATITEDGFTMRFTADSWQLFRQAVASGQSIQIPGTEGGMNFSLSWGNQKAPSAADKSSESQSESKLGGFFSKFSNRFKKK